MDVQTLKPERLEVGPNSTDAARKFKHWLMVFKAYKDAASSTDTPDTTPKALLANCLSAENYEIISECSTYSTALERLEKTFIKPPNEVIARHHLATRKQSNESIDEYVRALATLSQECSLKPVTAEEYRQDLVTQCFTMGTFSKNLFCH